MKACIRLFSLALVLILCCTLLPLSARAGGGGAALLWESDHETEADFARWTVIDGNQDGYTFARVTETETELPQHYLKSALRPNGVGPVAEEADEYLISEPIVLESRDLEYVLDFYEMGTWQPCELYVCPADTELTADKLPSALGRAAKSWCPSSHWTLLSFDLTAYRGQTIRLVFRQHTNESSWLALDEVSIYWHGPDEILDKVTATGMLEPKAGNLTMDMDESDLIFPPFANYDLVPGSLTFYKTVNESPQAFTGAFEAGQEYTVSFVVEPLGDVDYVTDSLTGMASVNGHWAEYYRLEDDTVRVFYYLGWLREEELPFADVPKSEFFHTPVRWASLNGITKGTGKDAFSPYETCTRGQVVTFLWRAMDWPLVPRNAPNPFTDVTKDDYFYKPVLWALLKGVTQGVSSTQFGPYEGCTRGQVATFLWRAAGKPHIPADSVNPFTDVSKEDYFYVPVLWAYQLGITKGSSKTEFNPYGTCTRGEIVTFLYRYTLTAK